MVTIRSGEGRLNEGHRFLRLAKRQAQQQQADAAQEVEREQKAAAKQAEKEDKEAAKRGARGPAELA